MELSKKYPFAELIREWRTEVFRKEEFRICFHAYKRKSDGKLFMDDDELILLNETQVKNQYRSKHKIPFPNEIKRIREQYGLSAARMSEVLDFGINSYRQYEEGQIPSLANSKLIKLARNPKNMLAFAEEKQDIFSTKAYQRFLDHIQVLKAQAKEEKFPNHLWNEHTDPNEFTGFVKPRLEKVANYIIYFAQAAKPLKTRLNKLLFYSDFLHYKRTGFAISGVNYRAIQMGPVPSHFRELYGILEKEGFIRIDEELFDHGGIGERFLEEAEFDKSLFSPAELESMEATVAQFEEVRTKQIIELSHEESGWIQNNEQRELISYQDYAFDLKAFA